MSIKAIPNQTVNFAAAAQLAKLELVKSIKAALTKFEADTGLVPIGLDVSLVHHRSGSDITGSIISGVSVEGTCQGVSVTV